MLLSLVSCSESDYQKIDKLLGLNPVPKDTTILAVEIVEDSSGFQPIKTKPYDSAKVAKKIEIIKDSIFKHIAWSKKGKTIEELLAKQKQEDIGRREDAKFINSRKRLLDSIYKSNSKKAKSITAKTDTAK